jgi:hypothetical protein
LFVGVHVVVTAVVDGDLDIDYWIAGDQTVVSSLPDALLDRRNEVLGYGTSDDLTVKGEAAASLKRLELNPAVAKLALASSR